MNYESQFIESQWKHAVSRMKMPAVRDSASSVFVSRTKKLQLIPSCVYFARVKHQIFWDGFFAEPLTFGRWRTVACLTVTDWQEFHFPHFPSNFHHFFLFSLKFFSFSSSLWLSRWAGEWESPAWLSHCLRWKYHRLRLSPPVYTRAYDARFFGL